MASTSSVQVPQGNEAHLMEEELEEETIWMEEEEVHGFPGDDKKLTEAYINGPGGLAAQETVSGEEYQEIDVVDYDDASHENPFRNNLPDLLSKKIQLDNGSTMTLCFSKRGIHQLAADGFLYNLSHSEGLNSTWVCINPECNAHIISASDMSTLSRDADVHNEMCEADEAQLRLRIAIYDLRLMAEFTDVSLALLYHNFAATFATENPGYGELFPPFETLHRSLETHRRIKIYRRRFDMRDSDAEKSMVGDLEVEMDDESMLLGGRVVSSSEEVVEESYAEQVPTESELARMREMDTNPFGRIREFPVTFCVECGIEMATRGGPFTPQHALVQHISRIHQPAKIHSFTFEPAAFELWLREVQRCSALRLRRLSLIGEDIFFLCAADDRLPKSKHSMRCHCSVYLKIHEYRTVSAREARLVNIEYCFDHFAHDVPFEGNVRPEKLIADLRPQAFLDRQERRRQSTAHLVRARHELANRRQALANSITMRHDLRRTEMAQPDTKSAKAVSADVFSTIRSETRSAITRQLAIGARAMPRLAVPRQMITKRDNFADKTIFDTVHQSEILADMIIRRLQNVKTAHIADYYYEVMSKLVNRILTDVDCAPEGSPRGIWSGVQTARHGGGAVKREARAEDGEEGGAEGKKKRTDEEAETTGGEEGQGEEREAGGEADEPSEDASAPQEEGAGPSDSPAEEGEGEQRSVVKSRGRSQLPVKSTLIATGRSAEAVDGGRKEGGGVTPQSVRRRVTIKEADDDEKTALLTPSRSRSVRIQAKKEKRGEAEEENGAEG